MEVLGRYAQAKDKLQFVVDWLQDHRDENGQWDFGPVARDGIYFPLSDRWDKATRVLDSTERVSRLLVVLSSGD